MMQEPVQIWLIVEQGKFVNSTPMAVNGIMNGVEVGSYTEGSAEKILALNMKHTCIILHHLIQVLIIYNLIVYKTQ